MAELTGMVTIVTGSSSGIGERIAQRLSELGASVVVNSASSVEAGQKVADALPGESLYVQADISDKAQCENLINETIKRFGKLDLLVNNAGFGVAGPLTEITDAELRAAASWVMPCSASIICSSSSVPSVATPSDCV